MVYSATFASGHGQLTEILDSLDPQCDWHAPMSHCLFFTSELSAQELATLFENRLGVGAGRLYLITEVLRNQQGRLTERGWRLLNNPDNPRGT